MQKIILYYKFTPIQDPNLIKLWQLELCLRLNLRGRIIISPIGINGTLGGDIQDLKAYKNQTSKVDLFKDIEYKWSSGKREHFPKLSVKTRDEPVTLESENQFNQFNSTKGLTSKQWHDFLEKNPNTVVLDARNEYESEIGHFRVKNLIRPKIKTFKEIKKTLKDMPKDQTILTYCTGDIRCEYLSAYMQESGFSNVQHLRGGIIKYGQKYKDEGFWQGKCYVFDGRMKIEFSKQAIDIANCLVCDKSTSEQVNCDDCNRQLVVCSDCQKNPYYHCQNPTVSSLRR